MVKLVRQPALKSFPRILVHAWRLTVGPDGCCTNPLCGVARGHFGPSRSGALVSRKPSYTTLEASAKRLQSDPAQEN